MSEVRQQVLIEAPPEVVWELITDLNRHPEWWPDVSDAFVDLGLTESKKKGWGRREGAPT
jgi:uncharacterized protein YndB with AHSA1/START domain